MNRIKKYGDKYFVLITPEYPVSPIDPSLLLGNWSDPDLRNYYVLEFATMNDAMAEALNYSDVDWYKMTLNHKYIFNNLETMLSDLIKKNNFNVHFIPKLLQPEEIKTVMFDRVIHNGERFNLRYGLNDIISFTIVNPWTSNLHYISKIIENHRNPTYRDDLRIRFKKIIDGKIIYLYGYTEYGTIYSIRLIPTLLHQVSEWKNKHMNVNDQTFTLQYNKLLKMQQDIDSGTVLQ